MRQDTGVFKPEGDWPGTFIRGDESMDMACTLEAIAKQIEDGKVAFPEISAKFLREYADLLSKCWVK